MIRPAMLFVGAFGICGALGAAAGCWLNDGNCDCASTPDLPPAQGAKTIGGVILVADADAPFHPEDGTLSVTGPKVVIRYEESGAQFEAVYAVGSPLY